MAEFKISSLRFTYVGVWATATTYKKDDVVSYAGKLYTCENAHTSSDVYSDLTSGNLSLTLDGKVFKGNWAPTTDYDLNDIVVVVESKSVYVCNTPHTSASTINFAYWDLLVQYEEWDNAWDNDVDYTVGTFVKYGGNVYICNNDHSSAPEFYTAPVTNINANGGTATVTFTSTLTGLVTNAGSTITLAGFNPSSYNGTYTILNVFNTSIDFLCTVTDPIVTNGTFSVTNDADWGGLELNISDWDLYFEGVEYKGDYQGGFRYKVNDLVKNGASIYKCTTAHTSAIIPALDLTKFEMYAEGEEYSDAWNQSTAYNPGDIVTYGGYVYVSTAFNNAGNTPEAGSLYWDIFNRGYSFQNDWSNSTNYKVGSVVRRNGNIYVAIIDNTGSDPVGMFETKTYNSTGSSGTTVVIDDTTDIYPGMVVSGLGFTTGPTVKTVVNNTTLVLSDAPTSTLSNGQSIYFSGHDGTTWNIVSTSVNWTNLYSLGYNYKIGDIVVYGNVTYRCVRNNVNTNPAEDADNLYWVVYLAHSNKNVLINLGDVTIVNSSGIKTNLIIPTESGLNLYSDGVVPTWKKTFVSPNVFYVSTDNGVDNTSAGYGLTWDKPFKTIAYTANYVKNGVLNADAASQLRNNKQFMTEEIIQWMYYQMQTSAPPFSPASTWDEDKSRRDLYLIIDAIVYDLTRGGNSQSVASALSYFKLGSTTEWFNAATEASSPYIVASLTFFYEDLLPAVLDNLPVTINYQSLMSALNPELQSFFITPSPQAKTDALSLLNLIVTAVTNQDTSSLPVPNQGVSATIYIKTGTYKEELPIVVPANCCLAGDELRGVTVEPLNAVNTIVTRSYSLDDTLEAYTTIDMYVGCPIVFITSNAFGATGVPIQRFESSAIEVGTTYYVRTIVSSTKFTISATPNGASIPLAGELGTMLVYGGEALGDMFYLRNGSGLRNMTLSGLLGTLTPINEYLTQRPTGGAYASLDPGEGPDDSEAWIVRRSPYVQNVTTFGIGCTGLKIDGTLHNGGNKSIVCNDYTHILSDGIGIWCTGTGSLCEAVSVFSYYGYAGYFSEDGGRIRATNGNSSYGQLGVVAEGYDITESPITGNVFNRQYEAQANIGFVDDVNSGILNYTFSNAGQDHFVRTTNLLTYSNSFTGVNWSNDGNVILTQGSAGPDGLTNAWLFTALTSSSNTAFLTQDVTITPSTGFTLVNQPYTFSIYLKEGTSAYVDIHAIFSGNTTRSSGIRFTWSTKAVTTVNAAGDGGFTPTTFGVETLANDWYRVYFVVYDNTALNSTLTFKLYPRGKDGSSGSVYVYGSQIENGSTLGPYLDNKTTTRYSAYANFVVVGNGSNALTVADEIRSQAVFETRITDPGDEYGRGGQNYLTSSNAAQTGGDFSITLANADTNLATNYIGMALYIISGTGVGQYGQITSYNSTSKVASIGRSNFESVQITASASSNNRFDVSGSADFNTLYVNQPIQFVPFYYNTTSTATSTDYVEVTASTGGQTNTFTVASTARLATGMPITFTGTIFGGVINNYTYYISEIVNLTTIKITTRLFGSTLFLNTATGSMTLNYGSNANDITVASTAGMTPNLPIQFSGNTMGGILASNIYYINDVIDGTTVKISSGLVTASATNTTVTTNIITVGSSSGLVPNNPIVFSGTSFGGITAGTKYYISDIPSSTQIKISSSLIYTSCSQTTTGTNRFTVASTTGMLVGSPITFYGNVFGGVVAEQTYWILSIPSSTQITVTATRGGAIAVTLNTVSGFMFVRTAPASVTLSTASGTLTGTSTNVVKTLTPATGEMTVVYQTSLFGGITQGTTYYVLQKFTGATNQFTITATSGGSTPVTLSTANGSMSMLAAGWDNVIAGKPNAALLDTSSYYFIEPRLTYTPPPFTQVSATLPTQSTAYTAVGYGDGYWLALGTNSTTLARSVNGTTWTTATLPASTTWTGLAYGNKYWIALRSGSNAAHFSNDNGETWKFGLMPSSASWTHIAFGNNTFVAIDNTNSSAKAAYTTNYGSTWSSATLSLTPASGWKSITYGAGTFVAIPGGSTNTASISTDFGATWSTVTLPITTTWESVAYGNGRFVAVSSTSNPPAYSFDGVTWYSGLYSISANRIVYGQGVFVALPNGSTSGYTSESGMLWKTRTITSSTYAGMAFGFDSANVGKWVTVAGQTTGSVVQAGATAKVRGIVTTGQLQTTLMLDPGSNYTSTPTLTVFDPNATVPVVPQVRTANGVLANPTFINRGSEYATNTTYLNVLGKGFADQYQTDLYVNLNNLTLLPRSGDNLSITGDDTVYKITSAEILNGTSAPNITARVGVSPAISFYLSPANGTSLIVRQKFSQVRLTNHDWLNIGYGDQVDSNYPGVPPVTIASPQDQAIENNFGRVFYTSTDQDGNFKVGSLFGVEQATGIVTVSASQFGLSGLSALSLGGISVGNISVIVRQFSTDPTFVANSDNILPTQKAVKSYIASRLSQGGANTFTGNLVAGVVSIGGANIITSTVVAPAAGSTIQIPVPMKIGAAGIDGNMVAQAFFASTWNKVRRVF